MLSSRYRTQLIWLAISYAGVIALALYPGLHEGFAGRALLWNCVPPTVGLALMIAALGKSKRRMIASAVFGVITAAVTLFFFAAWFFTPLDTDPHSSATVLVFIYAPAWSLVLATIGSVLTWLATRAA